MLENNPSEPENTLHTWKYQKYPKVKKIPENNPIVYFDTPTRPELDPLPGILSNTRPNLLLKNPTRCRWEGSK